MQVSLGPRREGYPTLGGTRGEASLAALPFSLARESLSLAMLAESALVPDMAVSGAKNLRKPKRIFMA